MAQPATDRPLSGLWKPTKLRRLHYGPHSVKAHLLEYLPSSRSKAFIISGSSLATKTSLIKQVEELLGSQHHAGTFSNIKQHAPVAQLDEATDNVRKDSTIDTLISIGGGSPIDSAKAISYRLHEQTGKFLYHITVPTTLSAAECTYIAGYTNEEGTKISVADPELAPHVIIYDSQFALETPQKLWLSTGIRALDHAVEMQYHPSATEVPAKQMALNAIGGLFEYLPKAKAEPKNEETITRLLLAAFSSIYAIGENFAGGLGLSHSMGYALGSPYGIPHGMTSCLTLSKVVKLKANTPESAAHLAQALPFIGKSRSGNDRNDANKFADAIEHLVQEIGLESNLGQYGVGEDQIPKIARLATKSEGGELFDGVSAILRSRL